MKVEHVDVSEVQVCSKSADVSGRVDAKWSVWRRRNAKSDPRSHRGDQIFSEPGEQVPPRGRRVRRAHEAQAGTDELAA